MTLAQRTFAEIEMKRARRDDPDTSKQAAAQSRGVADRHRSQILAAMNHGGRSDWAPHELAEQCELSSVQVSRRIKEMWEDGLIRESGATRPTPSGRMARCWKLVLP